MRKISFVAAAMLLSAAYGVADILVDFDFTGNAGDEATVAPAAFAAGLAMTTPLSRGNGLGAWHDTWDNDGYSVRFSATDKGRSEALSISDGVYATFSFTVNSGFSASLSALDFGWRYQNEHPNRRFFALASIDGGLTGFTESDIIATTNATRELARYALDLSQCERLQNIPGGTLVEIRIYHCNDKSSGYEGEAISSQGGHPGLDLLGTIGVTEGAAPAVVIAKPVNNTHFPFGAWPESILISALAVDDGAVEEVSFYCGDSLIGSTNEAPYEIIWQWAPAQGAEYLLTAVARDDSGNYGTSDVVRVTAGVDLPPVIALVSPANNTILRYGGSTAALLISANALDDSSVTNVEFFVNGETLGNVAQAPFELAWGREQPAGIYRFHAVATDNIGQSTHSSTNFLEVLDKQQDALLAFDNFASAPTESELHSKNTGAGWAGAWGIQDGNTIIPGYNISDANPLSYRNLKSDPQYATGGRDYKQTKRRLNVDADGPFADYLVSNRICAPGETLWISFLKRIDRSGADGMFSIAKCANNSPRGYAILHVKNSASFWEFVQYTNDYNFVQSADLGAPVVVGEAALFVIRVDFGVDGINHTASCWVNPDPGTLGAAAAPPPDATLAIEDPDFWFDGINWYPQATPGAESLDEFRIGKTWASVTPPILPGATLLILR